MKLKRLPVLHTSDVNNISHFIKHWSLLYQYQEEDLYNKTIVKSEYDVQDIENLYLWKNGMKLSSLKVQSLKKNVFGKGKVDKLNLFKKEKISENDFLEEFKSLKTTVWKVFLLHIAQPNKYPIYDQHIHRTYCFVHGLDWKGINNKLKEKAKYNFYFEQYRPFVLSLNYKNLKEVDNAFFAFGQFINTKRHQAFFNPV